VEEVAVDLILGYFSFFSGFRWVAVLKGVKECPVAATGKVNEAHIPRYHLNFSHVIELHGFELLLFIVKVTHLFW
jgi:hypothetical protein